MLAPTFDGPNKLAILAATTTTLDLIEFWSHWKVWLLTSSANAGHALGYDNIGGQEIDPVSGKVIPIYLFQKNGWKIRPQEADHTLEVVNGMLIGESGGDPFVSTIGDYQVRLVHKLPVEAIGYNLGGGGSPTAEAIATAVWQRVIENNLTAEQLIRLMASVSQGDAAGLEGASPTFKSVDGQTVRVAATYNNGARTITTRNPD